MQALIDAVKCYPALYNTSHEDYPRTKLKEDLWDNLAKQLKYSNGKDVKEEWQKLRERHREALRRQRQKRRGQPTCLWTFQREMEFLTPFMKNRPSTVRPPSTPSTPKREESSEENEEESNPLDTVDNYTHFETTNNVEVEESDGTADQSGIIAAQFDPSSIKIEVTEEQPLVRSMFKVFNHSFKKDMINTEDRVKRKYRPRNARLPQNQSVRVQNDAMFQFFMSMYNISKTLPLKQQRQVRRKVFAVVSQAEDDADSDEQMDE